MPTLLVVENLDVVEELRLRFPEALEIFSKLLLQRGKPALNNGVVLAVASWAHAALDFAKLEANHALTADTNTLIAKLIEHARVSRSFFPGRRSMRQQK